MLADADSPVLITPAFDIPASMWHDEELAIRAFRMGEGVPWSAHHERLACSVAAFYRNAYKGTLVPVWLPALDGVVERLEAGAKVADVGCGHGHSTVLMAEAFPRSTFVGSTRTRSRWPRRASTRWRRASQTGSRSRRRTRRTTPRAAST